MIRRSPLRRASEKRAEAARNAGSTFTRAAGLQSFAQKREAPGGAEGNSRPPRKRPQVETFPAKVARLIDERDSADGVRLCVHCGSPRNLHRHHRKLKQAGGTSAPHAHCACVGVTLCAPCHTWAHDVDRRGAEAEGLIISQSVTEPWTEPVLVHERAGSGGVLAFPTCTGVWVFEAPAGRAAS